MAVGARGPAAPLPIEGGAIFMAGNGKKKEQEKSTLKDRLPELRQRAQALAQAGLDDKTIAILLRVQESSVQKHLSAELEFGRAMLKAQIMRAQVKAATEDRDVAMLKRLGEEFCGQGVITQQGAIANIGKKVFVLNVGVPPKDLDAAPPGPVRVLPARKAETLEAEFEDVTPEE